MMRPMSLGCALIVLLTAGLAACAPASDSASGSYEVRDSAGVEIVEAGEPEARWQLSAEPELRIGVLDGDPAYQFNRVTLAARLEDGRVVAVSAGDSEIRFFDPDGEHRGSVGHEGEGPGEFMTLSNAHLGPGDTLWVHDTRTQRITLVGPDQAIGVEHSLRGVDLGASPALVAPLGGNRVVIRGRASGNTLPSTGGAAAYFRDTASVAVIGIGGEDRVDLTTVPGSERIMEVSSSSGGAISSIRISTPPFRYDGFHDVVGGLIVTAEGGAPELRMFDSAGGLVRIVRLTDRAPQAMADRVAEVGEGAREMLDLFPDGHVVPYFDELRADRAGRVWLRAYRSPWQEGAPQHWTVFGSDGRPLARLELPASLTLHDSDGRYAVGVEEDELEVEYVVVYRIEEMP